MAKIAKAQGRSVKEWIGKTPDSRPPPSVMLRIFDRWGGCCHITGKKIMPGEAWEGEHIKALEDGGENRESNYAPALVEPHKVKTAEERARRKRADAMKRSHLGLDDEAARPLRSGQTLPPATPAHRATTPPTKICAMPSALARRFKATEDA